MAITSIDIPEELLERAKEVLGVRTTRDAVVASLELVVRRGDQADALRNLAGMTYLADLRDPETQAPARR